MYEKFIRSLAKNVETLQAILWKMFHVQRDYGMSSTTISGSQHMAVVLVWNTVEGFQKLGRNENLSLWKSQPHHCNSALHLFWSKPDFWA